MRIAIAGLGYVGAVTAGCFADAGHRVVAVDIQQAKVDQLNRGESPIVEPGLGEIIAANVARGRLSASTNLVEAVASSDVVVVCVGTPSSKTGDVYLSDIEGVVGEIGTALASSGEWRLVIITSTVPPGTVEDVIIPILEKASGKTYSEDFGVVFSPEFLREGTGVQDFRAPSKTVLGTDDMRSLQVAEETYAAFTQGAIATSFRVAEMVKFSDNAWHALKVAFANEIGRFASSVGADSHNVMRIFKLDSRLNISEAYLTPGFAFGGSCLPKDLRTLTYRATAEGLDVPVLQSILESNRQHLEFAVEKVKSFPGRRVALLGIAFKSGTDDLRESPQLQLAERLIGSGYDVAIHDEHVSLNRLVGVNRDYVITRLPHIASLLRDDLEATIADSEIIVVGHASPLYANVVELCNPDQVIIDLSGGARPRRAASNYYGLTW